MMETKELTMFKNMKTRWISFLNPLRIILLKYKPLLAKMSMYNNNNQVAKVTFCLNLSNVSCIVCYLLQCCLHFLIDGLLTCWFLLHVRNVLHHIFVGQHWLSCEICSTMWCLHMWFSGYNKSLPWTTLFFIQWWQLIIF